MTPTPNPDFLTRDFPSATRSRMKILSKENLVGTKTAATAISRISKAFLSDQGSKCKISRLGGWGWKNDPDPFLNIEP